ncbi:hypothetical protein BJ138DRAFT_762123 [Hygrophoropsis aurantiaca]|uniref:Uncharacterized protein n=1 Tax=Hygrophoropsis aurantiaca TaxID=72124 RepID=A0ACB8ASJ2_9AGAM|nr:hypothetical protein BJ138DRAFT_762123 [Hygrophoropsis aurantiaca]
MKGPWTLAAQGGIRDLGVTPLGTGQKKMYLQRSCSIGNHSHDVVTAIADPKKKIIPRIRGQNFDRIFCEVVDREPELLALVAIIERLFRFGVALEGKPSDKITSVPGDILNQVLSIREGRDAIVAPCLAEEILGESFTQALVLGNGPRHIAATHDSVPLVRTVALRLQVLQRHRAQAHATPTTVRSRVGVQERYEHGLAKPLAR